MFDCYPVAVLCVGFFRFLELSVPESEVQSVQLPSEWGYRTWVRQMKSIRGCMRTNTGEGGFQEGEDPCCKLPAPQLVCFSAGLAGMRAQVLTRAPSSSFLPLSVFDSYVGCGSIYLTSSLSGQRLLAVGSKQERRQRWVSLLVDTTVTHLSSGEARLRVADGLIFGRV